MGKGSQEFAELVNADVCVTKDGAQSAGWDSATFVDRDGHALSVRLAPKMQMTAALTLFDKASTLEGTNQILAINTRKFVAHAGTGTERRVMNRGSCSTGIDSPSACILST